MMRDRMRQWWNSEGVAYAMAAALLFPGIAAAVAAWMHTGSVPFPVRIMCCCGVGCVTSTLVLILAALIVHRKGGK